MNADHDVEQLLKCLQDKLGELLDRRERREPLMIGIRTGGVWVARQLHRQMQLPDPLGELNINFYRDDFTRIGLHPRVQPSTLETSVDNRHVILVDDVLYTGRTIRAALNEIFDYGRPASVTLAVLVDRGGRELPVQADVFGMQAQLAEAEQIKLIGPVPLVLELQSAP